MIKRHIKKRSSLVDDLPLSQNIELRWSKDKTTIYIDGIDKLPDFMLKRLAEHVFDKMPKSKIMVWFL